MLSSQTGSQTFDSTTRGARPRTPEEDPATIQRELVLAVDRLATLRASAPEIENAAAAARSNFERAGVDVHAAAQLVQALEAQEIQALDALTFADPADVEARLSELSARRAERRLAIDDMNAKQGVADAAHRSLAAPRTALDDMREDAAQTLRNIETWRARAKAHPVPRHKAPTKADKKWSPADQRAHAYGYADDATMARSQFLASLPADVRVAAEADAATLDACLALLSSGDRNGAIGHAYAFAATATKAKASK